MSEEKITHTPGPWEFRRGDFNGNTPEGALGSIVGPDGLHDIYYLAQVWGDFEEETADAAPCEGVPPHGTAEANARLIAAAPELLSALKMAMVNSDALEARGIKRTPELIPIYEAAKAAIAKAER